MALFYFHEFQEDQVNFIQKAKLQKFAAWLFLFSLLLSLIAQLCCMFPIDFNKHKHLNYECERPGE